MRQQFFLPIKVCSGNNTSSITYILHEFAADWSDLLAQCCTEHHDLLLMGCDLEDVLYITSHVCYTKRHSNEYGYD